MKFKADHGRESHFLQFPPNFSHVSLRILGEHMTPMILNRCAGVEGKPGKYWITLNLTDCFI